MDLVLRELEREAATGDNRARSRLFFRRKALGICVDCGGRARRKGWSDIWPPLMCWDCEDDRIWREMRNGSVVWSLGGEEFRGGAEPGYVG